MYNICLAVLSNSMLLRIHMDGSSGTAGSTKAGELMMMHAKLVSVFSLSRIPKKIVKRNIMVKNKS